MQRVILRKPVETGKAPVARASEDFIIAWPRRQYTYAGKGILHIGIITTSVIILFSLAMLSVSLLFILLSSLTAPSDLPVLSPFLSLKFCLAFGWEKVDLLLLGQICKGCSISNYSDSDIVYQS